MATFDMIDTLEQLSLLSGVSGCEDEVRDAICTLLEGHCDYRVDALGNVIARKKGRTTPKNRILLSAHMDEVGFIITYIDDNGFLRFSTVGGIDNRVIAGKAVVIGKNHVPGVIGAKATHQVPASEREEPISPDKLYIDIGATSKEEALSLVRLGDRAAYVAPFQRFGQDKIMGKAFDDRAGCVMMLDMIYSDLAYDCTFSFTVQEENGCIGGTTAAYGVDPDIGIAVETTTASDIGGTSPDKVVCKQGDGAAVSFMDKGTAYDGDLFRRVFEVAEKNNLPCQAKAGVYGGTEGRVIQTAKAGARALTISLPCRYLHTPSNMLQISDIHNTRKLLELAVEEFANL
ncbi:MAG: M42 family metallopeptidase [Oscillospiraceae bacterium]